MSVRRGEGWTLGHLVKVGVFHGVLGLIGRMG
jgi:hypothetical protein